MKVLKLVVCLVISMILNGCIYTMRANTKAPDLAQYTFPKLNIGQPVAVNNISQNHGDVVLEKVIFGWNTKVDLYELTVTTVDIAKKVFESEQVKVVHNASKVLDLSVDEVHLKSEENHFIYLIELRVETGDGLVKTYNDEHDCVNFYRSSAAIEGALAKCVEKMFNDQDIIAYLQK